MSVTVGNPTVLYPANPVEVPIGALFLDETSAKAPAVKLANGTAALVTSTAIFLGLSDARILSDGIVNNGNATLTSASAAFTIADVGKVVLVVGAASGGTDLATTIASFTSATQVQLTIAAGATLSGVTWGYGSDNTSRLSAALAAISGTGGTLIIPAGQYMFGGFIDFSLLNNLTVSGYGATLIAAIPGAPGSGSIFFRGGSVLGPNLALNANVAANQRTFQMQTGAPLSVGQTVELNAGETGAIYTVTAVAGSSPQTVTVDRVILFPYLLVAGARVNVVTSLITRVFIQGLTFVGACEWYIKIRGVTNSFTRDCSFLATISFASTGAFLLSEFSFNWGVDSVYVNGPTGAGMTSCEQCWLTRYTFTGTPNSPFAAAHGFQFLECANCGMQDFDINGATATGVFIDQLASQPNIPYDVGVTLANGFIGACATFGVSENGYYTLIDTVLIVGNGSSGITLGAASENPKISRCRILNNGNVGISNNAGISTGTGATIFDCLIANNTADVASSVSGIVSQGPLLYIIGCQIVGLAAAAGKFCLGWSDQGFTFGCTTIVDDCDLLVSGTSTGASIVQTTGSPSSIISNTRLRFNGGASFVGSGINNLNGKMQLDNVQVQLLASTVPGQGLATAAGSLTRINQNCNFDGCTTPVSMGGFCNRSINGSSNANSVTLNGTTPVNYGFTDTKSTDRVQLILRTRGSTAGNGAVLVAITAGTGISLAGNAASVNDVYDVVIG
jgi:hypothetical protein